MLCSLAWQECMGFLWGPLSQYLGMQPCLAVTKQSPLALSGAVGRVPPTAEGSTDLALQMGKAYGNDWVGMQSGNGGAKEQG